MLFRQLLLPGVLAPAVVGGLIAAALPAVWRRRRRARERPSAWHAALAIAAGFATTYWAIGGSLRLPPVDTTGWLLWLVMIAGVGGALWPRLAPPWRGLLVVGLAIAVAVLTARPLMQHSWSNARTALWLPLAAALVAAVVAGSIALARLDAPIASHAERVGWALPAVAVLVTAGAAIALGLSASARLAQLAGALTAAVSACAVVRLAARTPLALPGEEAAVPLGVAYAGLLLNGHLYAALPLPSLVALAASPGAAWLAARAIREPGVRRTLAALAAAAVVTFAAAAQPIWKAATEDTDPYDY